MIADFHFIRPWWLLAIVPAAMILWVIARQKTTDRKWRQFIAPELLPHLLIRHRTRGGWRPLVLLGLTWLLATIVAAGPTWRREPSPFVEDTAALVIVLKVTLSMKSQDIQPDRLSRSVQKIHDLLEKRPGAKTALVVYSGSVHTVVPLTGDAGIINNFAEALDPQIMPSDGDACVDALRTAASILQKAKLDGSILWINDGVVSAAPSELGQLKSLPTVRLLQVATDGPAEASIEAAADEVNADVIPIQPDDSDVQQLARDTHFATSGSGEEGGRWRESGYAVVPVVLLAALPLFRRGMLGAIEESGEDA